MERSRGSWEGSAFTPEPTGGLERFGDEVKRSRGSGRDALHQNLLEDGEVGGGFGPEVVLCQNPLGVGEVGGSGRKVHLCQNPQFSISLIHIPHCYNN